MIHTDASLRHAKRRVGLMVLAAVGLLAIAMLQAGVLRDLFKSASTLHILLPDSGFSGLNPGAAVEILGTKAGTVRRVIIDPTQNFHAIAEIDEAMKPFIRRDSKVSIRRQFGIATATYLEIKRGSGAPLDWDYAVLSAEPEVGTFETIGNLVSGIERKVIPILDDTHRTVKTLADLAEQVRAPDGGIRQALADVTAITGGIRKGEGSIGRMIADDTFAREAEATMVSVNKQMSQMAAIIDNLKATSGDVTAATRVFATQSEKLPVVMDNVNATLVSLNHVMRELGKTMPEVSQLARNSSNASVALPAVLAQTQQTMAELQQLLLQLQGSWLLGGGREPVSIPRLSSTEARP